MQDLPGGSPPGIFFEPVPHRLGFDALLSASQHLSPPKDDRECLRYCAALATGFARERRRNRRGKIA
jgi:hypothetical protein